MVDDEAKMQAKMVDDGRRMVDDEAKMQAKMVDDCRRWS